MGANGSVGGASIAFFSKILLIAFSGILLHGIVENACNMLTLIDNTDIIFEYSLIGGAANNFSRVLGNVISRLLLIEIA